MPLQNRVLATGEIIAHPARGMFMGNRGILHGDTRELGRKRWTHKAWVTCVLTHKDWHRVVMTSHRYTELFFLDEAVALAAGHRPCALCRRKDYDHYRQTAELSGPAKDMDTQMHKERAHLRRFAQRRHQFDIATVPDGAVILEKWPMLLWQGTLRPVTPEGYQQPLPKPKGIVTVLTPPTSLKALRTGYRPKLHPTLTGS
ncbi:MAG: hypothetical protein HKN27_10290 [Silicimonas sp.]|nr:hypothetical protein [Silicimonas sp.]